jgi:putative two-component system response regulator
MTQTVSTVLIVDDEPAVRELMSRWVTSLGLQSHTAASAGEALETLRTTHYDLAVIDVMMPGQNGLWLATEMQRDHPHTAVVIATAYTDLLDANEPRTPIADFLVKPFQRERFALALDRGRQWREHALKDVEWHARLSAEVQDRIVQVCAHIGTRAAAGDAESDVLFEYAYERTADTMTHSDRVARFATTVARQMGVLDTLGASLEIAARFHDIGKVAMPDALLTKPSALSPGELAIMRRHVDAGAEILDATRTLRGAAPIVLASHEWYGGGGYPHRLAGTDIPLASRIIAAADAFDAMTQARTYRLRLDSADAVSELLRCCPTQFDPEVVDAFLAVLGRH